MRGRGLTILSGPTPMEQEVEVEVDGGLLMVSRPSAASPVVWASPAFLFRLVLSLALLVFPCPAVAARVSSSLSTTHHVHHFHNKHGTVPIAINRMPFLTRGGHGKIILFNIVFVNTSKNYQSNVNQWFCWAIPKSAFLNLKEFFFKRLTYVCNEFQAENTNPHRLLVYPSIDSCRLRKDEWNQVWASSLIASVPHRPVAEFMSLSWWIKCLEAFSCWIFLQHIHSQLYSAPCLSKPAPILGLLIYWTVANLSNHNL